MIKNNILTDTERDCIINELKYCYNLEEIKEYFNDFNLNDNDLISLFNQHCEKNAENIKISDLINNYNDKEILISTPDGYKKAGTFYIKKPRKLLYIETENGFHSYVSSDHLFETNNGWKLAKDILENDDKLLTKGGFDFVKELNFKVKKQTVYDIEILSDEHRYWSGNGISSHNSGKTYLALSICKNAQKKGYSVIYLDSEASIDKDFVERLGCDPSKILIKQVTTITEVSTFIANLTKALYQQSPKNRSKVIIVLDSLGNLTSSKELTDTIEGNAKRDMTKQQEIKALFRTNTTSFGKLQIPFIVCTHTYATQDLFSKQVVSGGSGITYNSSITLMLSTARLEDKDSDKLVEKKTGEYIKTGVIVTAKPEKTRFTIPQKVKFQIPFFKSPNPYVGLETYITWDNSGILRGKLYTQKEYDKLFPSDKTICDQYKFEYNNEFLYAYPKDTAKTIVVKHLGTELLLNELFTDKVMTNDILKNLDENIIKPNFELPSQYSGDDLDEVLSNMNNIEEEK